MTTTEAMKKVHALVGDKLNLSEIFEIYDIISACNMGGWQEGNKTTLKTFAPSVYEILYPETPLDLIAGFMGTEEASPATH